MKISAVVIKGKGKGKILGYPTINVTIGGEVESGVYAGRVKMWEIDFNSIPPPLGHLSSSSCAKDSEDRAEGRRGLVYPAGIFISRDGKLLEAHLIGFEGDLYGKEVEVEILNKIREVRDFENEEELVKQIGEDLEKVKSQKSKVKNTG